MKPKIPQCYKDKYDLDTKTLTLYLNGKPNKKSLRGLDPWGLVLLAYHLRKGDMVKRIVFSVKSSENIETFVRRVSFLAVNNTAFNFSVEVDGKEKRLYSRNELFTRPTTEVIRKTIKEGTDKDRAGRVEKDLQTFLFGKGKNNKDGRTNERLAIFGEDFFKLKSKKLPILREFPTGVFLGKKSKSSRILPTDFVDIVTLNKNRQLSLIEIKVNDSQLEVISQILDYTLFFKCYFKQLLCLLNSHGIQNVKDANDFVCYVANNHFHPQFETIMKFYATKGKGYGFNMKQIVLGDTRDMG